MKAVILAGGRGMRLKPLTDNIPKVMVKVGGQPIIEHQIKLLKESGITDIWILLGYLGDKIRNYFKTGEKWGVKLHYIQEGEPLGSAGCLRALQGKISGDFLLFSGDVMMNFDVRRFVNWHRKIKNKIASVVVHPNDHPFDSDLVEIDQSAKVLSLLARPHPEGSYYRNLSIAAVYLMSSKILSYVPADQKIDIEKGLLPIVLEKNQAIYCYQTPEYFKDMGTPERLKTVRRDYASGRINKYSLKNKQPAVFLDRDGVLVEAVDQLSHIEDLRPYDFGAKAVKKINDLGYLVIIITNQAMIAKGFMTEKDLLEMNKKLETELGYGGAKIDGFYHCPHHSKKGFAVEIPELKKKCSCRKPGISLLERAAKDFNLDMKKSVFIGDSSTDAKTAENAKIKFIGVKTGYVCKDGKYPLKKKPRICKNLLAAVNYLPKL